MIHTSKTVAVGNQESIIDSPIVLYRGDREVEVEFTLTGNKYTFSNGGNVIKSVNATHGQLVLNTPTRENTFSEVTECHDGKVVFVITKEMIDELIEVGFYSFQIRLFDESQVSRVTIPPVYKGIDIRNPIAAEDETNVVDIGLVDYAVVVKDEFEDLSTFLPDGNYNKTEWKSKDVISGVKLNKIEDALYTINGNMESSDLALFNQIDQVNQNINRDFKELNNEITSEVEEFERGVNNNIERLKVDVSNTVSLNNKMQKDYTDYSLRAKADIKDVRMNNVKLTLDDFDDSTKSAILGSDNISVNAVIGEESIVNDNIARQTINADRMSFTVSKRQYIDYSNITHGRYYSRFNAVPVETENAHVFPPIRIHIGVEYFYTDLYAYFSIIHYDDGVKIALSSSTSNRISGSFIAENNGYLYPTLSDVAYTKGIQPILTNSRDMPNEYIYGEYHVEIPSLEVNNVKPENTTFAKSSIQYIDYDTEQASSFYQIADGEIKRPDNRDYETCSYDPIKITAGVTYHFKLLYTQFSFLLYDNTDPISVYDYTGLKNNGSFYATNDGYLYCTLDHMYYTRGDKTMITNSSEFPDDYIFGEYAVSIDNLKLDLSADDVAFLKRVEQFIDNSDSSGDGCYYGHNSTTIYTNGVNSRIVKDPIPIKKGIEYYYNNIYGYFCLVKYDNGTNFTISNTTSTNVSGMFIAEDDGYFYVTISTEKDVYTKNTSISNSKKGLIADKVGFIGYELINDVNDQANNSNSSGVNIITVKKSGGDYNKIVDAVNSIKNPSIDNQYEIHVYSGVYDIVDELGGLDWVVGVTRDNGERQGLTLPDYTHLIGHGSVYIDCIVSDNDATSDFSRCVSTINIYMNNRLEGITFRAKNTRYVIHDETNNSFSNLTRVIKNCRFIHQGNGSGLWGSYKAMGGGLGSGGRYDILNSHFESPFVPFTYHNNNNQNTNYINIDGCTFCGNKSGYDYDIGFGYYKKNTEKTYITVKNCISDRGVKVYQETQSVESDNVLELIEIGNVLRGEL